MMRNKSFLCTLSLISFLLAGCNSVQSSSITPTQPSSMQSGYPIEVPQNQESGYPAPEIQDTKSIEALTEIDLPSPETGKASISGVLVNYSASTLMENVDIYLTKAAGEENNEVPPILAGALEDQGDIRGKTNENGQFVFSNIAPGNYFLIVSMDLSPVTGENATTVPLLIRLEADSVSNLGVVYYSSN